MSSEPKEQQLGWCVTLYVSCVTCIKPDEVVNRE